MLYITVQFVGLNKAPRAGVHGEGQWGETGGRLMAPGPDPPSIQT